MKKDELVFNILLGLSMIAWGLMGLHEGIAINYSIVRIFSSILNLNIGMFIIFRNPVIKSGSQRSILISSVSLLLGGVLFKMAHPFNSWPFFLEITFVLGVLGALISFYYLGKNFAIFPDLRAISTKGPYSFIRHPGYASEIIITATCCIANFNLLTMVSFILLVFFLYFRIEEEEKILSESKDFVNYKLAVKWKLIPYLW